MSTRRTVLAGLLERLDSLDLSRAERTELRALLERELERYSERGKGRPSGPSARVRSRVRDVQLLRDMRETLEALLEDPKLGDADRTELEQIRDRYPRSAAAAFKSVGGKRYQSAEPIAKAFRRHNDAVRLEHANMNIKLGGEPAADKPKRRAPRRPQIK